jgi:hypothetical protein
MAAPCRENNIIVEADDDPRRSKANGADLSAPFG